MDRDGFESALFIDEINARENVQVVEELCQRRGESRAPYGCLTLRYV